MPIVQQFNKSEGALLNASNKDRRKITGVEQRAHGGKILRDGFQELFNFKEHRLKVNGICSLQQYEEPKSITANIKSNWRKEMFLSWDSKNIILWQHDKVHKLIRFPFSKQNYINCLVYIQKLSIFIAATSDLNFDLYDKNLLLVESIKHEERAILAMEYNNDSGFIVIAGALGLSVWRAYRSLNMDMSHVLEKLFTFQESIPWTNKIVYNSTTQGKIYALVDRSLHIFDINWRVRVNMLENIHEASITQCVWYARSQFYITSCNQGLIKCYSNIQMNDSFSNQKASKNNNSHSSSLALLHTFNLHTKAVTGLKLHPTVPGLLISSSLDCTIRVFNLEALTQLFFVHLSSGINNIQVKFFLNLS